jgi:hypothetical protein
MESIAMLNGIPTQLDRYLTSQARSVVTDSSYNANLAGLGAVENVAMVAQPNTTVTLKQRGGFQRRGLQPGLSRTAAASLMGAPTSAMSVAEQVRARSIVSQQYANLLAGIPESPAAAAAAARAGNIVSQQYSPNLAGISLGEGPADEKLLGMPKALAYGVLGLAAGFAAAKLMKR